MPAPLGEAVQHPSRVLALCAQDELESRGRELISVKSEETKKDSEILRLRKQLAALSAGAGSGASAAGAGAALEIRCEVPRLCTVYV